MLRKEMKKMSETEKKKQAFMAATRALDMAYDEIFLVQDKSFDSEQEVAFDAIKAAKSATLLAMQQLVSGRSE